MVDTKVNYTLLVSCCNYTLTIQKYSWLVGAFTVYNFIQISYLKKTNSVCNTFIYFIKFTITIRLN